MIGSTPRLEVSELRVQFDGFVAVDGVSFTATAGKVHFLIGPNGAGKTTVIDAITGLAKSTGTVEASGTDITGLSPNRIARAGVGRTFQTASVFEELSVAQNLDIALGMRRPRRALWTIRPPHDYAIDWVLDVIRLTAQRNHLAETLSHGQKQWLEIGMLLAQDAHVLLLDEPVAGMTQEERTATGELLVRLAEERCVVAVEHDMDFMRRFASIVTVLHQGRVLAEGTVSEVQSDPQVQAVYLGTAVPTGERNPHA